MSETIDGLKQRLVGAFVILSLAVIFLPMIFDKPHSVEKVTVEPVPSKPKFQKVVIEKPSRPKFKVLDVDKADNKVKKIDQIKSVPKLKSTVKAKAKLSAKGKSSVKEELVVNKSKVAKKTSPVKPVKKVVKARPKAKNKTSLTKPKVSHLPIFKNIWMVQLGTFSKTKNAYALRDRLRKDGFDGHAKGIHIKGKKAVRVFSGPFVNRRDAEKTKKKLDKKYKVDSLIIFFDA